MKCSIYTLIFSILCPLLSSGAFKAKPGLWKVDTTFETDGKTFNPQKQMEQLMANLPEEQKKKMQDLIKNTVKEQTGFTAMDLSSFCLTKEMVDKGDLMKQNKNSRCEHTVKTHTDTKVVMDFTCKDGLTGNIDWNFVSSTHYNGKVNGTDKDGRKFIVKYEAHYKKDKCE
jgi:hypothetical protein